MRFVRFNIVGAGGLVLQLALLYGLVRAGVPLVAATLIACEAAILHNFLWHDRWTWADRQTGSALGRLLRFHAANGLVSLVGGTAFTSMLSDFGLPIVAANLGAVVLCAGINFLCADRVVFGGGSVLQLAHSSYGHPQSPGDNGLAAPARLAGRDAR